MQFVAAQRSQNKQLPLNTASCEPTHTHTPQSMYMILETNCDFSIHKAGNTNMTSTGTLALRQSFLSAWRGDKRAKVADPAPSAAADRFAAARADATDDALDGDPDSLWLKVLLTHGFMDVPSFPQLMAAVLPRLHEETLHFGILYCRTSSGTSAGTDSASFDRQLEIASARNFVIRDGSRDIIILCSN